MHGLRKRGCVLLERAEVDACARGDTGRQTRGHGGWNDEVAGRRLAGASDRHKVRAPQDPRIDHQVLRVVLAGRVHDVGDRTQPEPVFVDHLPTREDRTGLVVALPGLFFHYLLTRKFERYKAFLTHLETVCTQVLFRRELRARQALSEHVHA